MNLPTFTIVLISVFLSVAAQISLKHGMSNASVKAALSLDATSIFVAIITNLSIIFGLLTYILSAALWLFVLSKVEVSKAYPFVGLGFLGTMLFAYWLLEEPMTLTKVVGTLLVIAGVALISK